MKEIAHLLQQETDGRLLFMSKQLFNASYRPHVPQSLAIILKRYINTKPKHKRETTKFLEELRNKLYFIYEYYQEVAKVYHKYPKSHQFELLLVRYIELEFEVLYVNNNSNKVNRTIERQVAQRVMRLLHMVLSKSLPCNDASTTKSKFELKNHVLKVLVCVKPEYLSKNKFIYNIAKHLFRSINGNDDVFCLETIWKHFGNANLTTSDYGTDDSDIDVLDDSNQDVQEVPLTNDGVSSMVTIEFVGDSSYMTYLEKQLDTDSQLTQSDTNDCSKSSTAIESNVFELSDSDDETVGPPPPVKRKKVNETTREKPKNNGVVTFEILDDDDDGNNYMVYMQKEVEAKKRKPRRLNQKCVEVIVCSDSEEESEDVKTPAKVDAVVDTVKENKVDRDVKIEELGSAKVDAVVDTVKENIFDRDVKTEELGSNSPVSAINDVVHTNCTNNFTVESDQVADSADVKLDFEETVITSEKPHVDEIKIENEQFLLNKESSCKIVSYEDIKTEIKQSVKTTVENCDSAGHGDDKTLDDLPAVESAVTEAPAVPNTISLMSNSSNNLINTQSVNFSKIEIKHEEVCTFPSENLEVPISGGIPFSIFEDTKKTIFSEVPENSCLFLNESELKIGDHLNTTDLIDPSLILQEIVFNSSLFQPTDSEQLSVKPAPFDENFCKSSPELPVTLEVEADQKSVLDGSLLVQKSAVSDLISSEECRITDSVLEKLILDNSFFLDEGKDFDLECFLFDEPKEGFETNNEFSEILLKSKDECLDHVIEGAQHVQLTWEAAFDLELEQAIAGGFKGGGENEHDTVDKIWEKVESHCSKSRQNSTSHSSLDRREKNCFNVRNLPKAKWQNVLKIEHQTFAGSSYSSNQS